MPSQIIDIWYSSISCLDESNGEKKSKNQQPIKLINQYFLVKHLREAKAKKPWSDIAKISDSLEGKCKPISDMCSHYTYCIKHFVSAWWCKLSFILKFQLDTGNLFWLKSWKKQCPCLCDVQLFLFQSRLAWMLLTGQCNHIASSSWRVRNSICGFEMEPKSNHAHKSNPVSQLSLQFYVESVTEQHILTGP